MTIDNSIGYYPTKTQIAPVWTWQVAQQINPNEEITSGPFSVAALSNPYTATLTGNSWALGYVFVYYYWFEFIDPPGYSVIGYLLGRTIGGPWRDLGGLLDFSFGPPPVQALQPFYMRRLPCWPEYKIVLAADDYPNPVSVEGSFSIVMR